MRHYEVGLIGCGNMARALARGWGQPVLCADPVAERARSLVAEVGGEASGEQRRGGGAGRSARALPQARPAGARSPREIGAGGPSRRPWRRSSPSRRWRRCSEAYPGRPVYRFIPSLPVEVRQGAVVQAAGPGVLEDGAGAHGGPAAAAATDEAVAELFAQLGTLVVLDDALVDVAMGLMSCAPAYVALVAEAQIDAGVRRGIPAAQGAQLVVQTLAGTAELLRRRDYDTMAVRREVSSPGGLTARGVDALERAGLRSGLQRRARCGPRTAVGDDPRQRAHRSRRLPVGADLRLHAADHRLHRHAAAVRRRHPPAVLAHHRPAARLPARRRTSRSCASSAASSPRLGGLDFSPMLAIIALYLVNIIVVHGIIS